MRYYTAKRPDYLEASEIWNISNSRYAVDIAWAIWEKGASDENAELSTTLRVLRSKLELHLRSQSTILIYDALDLVRRCLGDDSTRATKDPMDARACEKRDAAGGLSTGSGEGMAPRSDQERVLETQLAEAKGALTALEKDRDEWKAKWDDLNRWIQMRDLPQRPRGPGHGGM